MLRQALAKDRDVATASHNAMSDLTIPKLISAKEESSTGFAASEFRKQAGAVLRSDFKRIEYMIRKGEKQIKLLKMPWSQDCRRCQLN